MKKKQGPATPTVIIDSGLEKQVNLWAWECSNRLASAAAALLLTGQGLLRLKAAVSAAGRTWEVYLNDKSDELGISPRTARYYMQAAHCMQPHLAARDMSLDDFFDRSKNADSTSFQRLCQVTTKVAHGAGPQRLYQALGIQAPKAKSSERISNSNTVVEVEATTAPSSADNPLVPAELMRTIERSTLRLDPSNPEVRGWLIEFISSQSARLKRLAGKSAPSLKAKLNSSDPTVLVCAEAYNRLARLRTTSAPLRTKDIVLQNVLQMARLRGIPPDQAAQLLQKRLNVVIKRCQDRLDKGVHVRNISTARNFFRLVSENVSDADEYFPGLRKKSASAK